MDKETVNAQDMEVTHNTIIENSWIRQHCEMKAKNFKAGLRPTIQKNKIRGS